MGQCCTTTQKESEQNTQDPQSNETEKLIQSQKEDEKQPEINMTLIESDKENNITKNKHINKEIQNNKNTKNTNKYPYEINDHVILTNEREGIVKFVGEVEFTRGILYGIELLNDAMGKHDGMIKEKRYFQTKPRKATFVRDNKIIGKKKNESIEPETSMIDSNNDEDDRKNDVQTEQITKSINNVTEEKKDETNDEYKQDKPLLKENDKIQERNVISIIDEINVQTEDDEHESKEEKSDNETTCQQPEQEAKEEESENEFENESENEFENESENESENETTINTCTTWEQPRQDARGTCVYEMDSYNERQAKKDAKIIRSALVNNNHDKLLEITGHRNNEQRIMIRNAYQKMYDGKQSDLMWILRNDPTNQLFAVYYRNIGEFDAIMIYKAISGNCIDKYALNEIICTRTSNQIKEMKNAWNLLQDEEIKHWINSRSMIECISTVILNNDYKQFIIGLLNAKRTSNSKNKNSKVKEFVELLLNDKYKYKRNQKQMCQILMKWSSSTIRDLYKQFSEMSNGQTSLLDVIEEMFDNNKDLCNALCVIVTFCTDPYTYWSGKIKDSMSSEDINYEMLTRYIVTRCEIDLYNIINIFNKEYGDGKTLKEWIQHKTTGCSRQLLLLLCGYNTS